MRAQLNICAVPHTGTITPDGILVIRDDSNFGGPWFHERTYQFWKNECSCVRVRIDDSRDLDGMAAHMKKLLDLAYRVLGPDHERSPEIAELERRMNEEDKSPWEEEK